METVKVWCVRCLCGETYILNSVTSVVCSCGAKLVRKGKKCYAEVDTDHYDVSKQPHKEPAIYRYNMPVAG